MLTSENYFKKSLCLKISFCYTYKVENLMRDYIMYNVAIIGAGPAGIFAALEITKLKPDWKV